jgi:hypothetical protein
MYERLQKNEISLSAWAMMFDCDHLSDVRLSGQKLGAISDITSQVQWKEELKKTELRCADCHRVKTNAFGESKQVKPLISKEELKGLQDCKRCLVTKKLALFVAPCETTGQLRKYDTCNPCLKKDRDNFENVLAHEKLEFVEQYQGMTLV